jgi:hypothetical protein
MSLPVVHSCTSWQATLVYFGLPLTPTVIFLFRCQ